MARIDKYDPVGGGFRAPLNGAYTGSATPIAVGINASGRVVPGAGTTGIAGVLCKPDSVPAGTVVDIMKDGELVEFAGAAGTLYTADTTTGVIGTTAPDATHVVVGHTVEASRLIVGVARVDLVV